MSPANREKLVDFKVLRLKRALQVLGLDVTDATPETIIDLYARLLGTAASKDASAHRRSST